LVAEAEACRGGLRLALQSTCWHPGEIELASQVPSALLM
jgi:hypothetical protein